jgi:6-pyruvoyltetrahydropterin/6-carboxytetrahydropterin synthase
MLSLSKIFEFAASHRLFQTAWSDEKNYEVYGKCANPNGHGHSYKLEVTLGGQPDPETYMIINATELSALVKRVIIEELDHKNLNLDVLWLAGTVTTVENIIAAIWQRLAPEVTAAAPNAKLLRLKLWETNKVFAVLEADPED